MSDAASVSSSAISPTSTHDEAIHSSISDDSQLNDHRFQESSLPRKKKTERSNSLDTSSKPRKDERRYQRQHSVLLDSKDLRSQMVEDESDDESLIMRSTRPQSAYRNDSGIRQDYSFKLPPVNTRQNSAGEKLKLNDGILLGGKLARRISKSSVHSQKSEEARTRKFKRKASLSQESDADSHASRDSQETEEDVCFPMVPEHRRIRGIDFDEIEDFIKEQREENLLISQREEKIKNQQLNHSTGSRKLSSAALKYTPRSGTTGMPSPKDYANAQLEKLEEASHIVDNTSSTATEDNVQFTNGRSFSIPPDRFSFFHSENEETIHAPDVPSLVGSNQSMQDLFNNGEGTWWLDCVCPTDSEMKMLAKAFGIHPLTAEDIRMQETREKVELFKSYYFVCFHTFETDNESEDFLEPINVYIVVFRDGILTFHFAPISHPANVRRRVRQLRDYVNVSADWLCYALIDDITDEFAPVIHAIEYEADVIEDSVFVARQTDFGLMLQKIGESRRKVMTLMRLLSGKADVIKMFAKRCQDESQTSQSHVGLSHLDHAQPRGDIALYLGDIQDHIITMFQSLLSYEKIFSRSHSNYLAQLQVQSFNANNQVTEMLSKVTLIGTILVPLNLVTGLFGMNVHVPGQDASGLGWWFGILGVICFVVIVMGLAARWWLNRMEKGETTASAGGGRSVRSFGFKRQGGAKRERSILSLPTKINRYD